MSVQAVQERDEEHRDVNPANGTEEDVAGLRDVQQLGLLAAIVSLGYVFWVVGAMEMVERLAYYGVKAVAGLYAVAPTSSGGLGVTMSDYGWVIFAWALAQSFVPVLTGGLSDRYGYKQTIFLSTVVKILGYLTMATFATYWGFFAGAMILATGTAIFKPGIQGTLVKTTSRKNSSVAWGIFYQTVNIGGYIGPVLAAHMRQLAWHNVFYACAATICCNFLLILTYREPGIEQRLARQRTQEEASERPKSLFLESVHELCKPHVWTYLLIFSGFWFMFNSLFDVLPNYIGDWVDTHGIVRAIFGPGGAQNERVKTILSMSNDGQAIMPEGMVNIDAFVIMTCCFIFAYLSGKMRATTSMVVGTLLASAAMFMSGFSTIGWISLAAIVIFSIGEMLSSPKFTEFMGNFAPEDKKAMYLGFSQMSLAVGWTAEAVLATRMYDYFSSKDNFSREMLAQLGLSKSDIGLIPQGQAFNFLTQWTHKAPSELTNILYNAHTPGMLWYIMGVIGVISAYGIYLYGRWILTLDKRKYA